MVATTTTTAVQPEPVAAVATNPSQPQAANAALGDSTPASAPAPVIAVAPDRQKADDVFNEANKFLTEAQNMLATKKRDVTYKKAEKLFSKAKSLYAKLGVDDMVLQANLGVIFLQKDAAFLIALRSKEGPIVPLSKKLNTQENFDPAVGGAGFFVGAIGAWIVLTAEAAFDAGRIDASGLQGANHGGGAHG